MEVTLPCAFLGLAYGLPPLKEAFCPGAALHGFSRPLRSDVGAHWTRSGTCEVLDLTYFGLNSSLSARGVTSLAASCVTARCSRASAGLRSWSPKTTEMPLAIAEAGK